MQVVHRDGDVVRVLARADHRRAAAHRRRAEPLDQRDRRVVAGEHGDVEADLERPRNPGALVGDAQEQGPLAFPKRERIPDLLVDPIGLALERRGIRHWGRWDSNPHELSLGRF